MTNKRPIDPSVYHNASKHLAKRSASRSDHGTRSGSSSPCASPVYAKARFAAAVEVPEALRTDHIEVRSNNNNNNIERGVDEMEREQQQLQIQKLIEEKLNARFDRSVIESVEESVKRRVGEEWLRVASLLPYMTYLECQASGKWRTLPRGVRERLQPLFKEIDLSQVRYAEGIDTIHNNSVTIGYDIYFTKISMSLGEDTSLICHELEHVRQFFINNGTLTLLEKQLRLNKTPYLVDLHQDLQLENSATSVAQNALNQLKSGTKRIVCCKDNRVIDLKQETLQEDRCEAQLWRSLSGTIVPATETTPVMYSSSDPSSVSLSQLFLLEPTTSMEDAFKIRSAVSNLVLDAHLDDTCKNGCHVRFQEDQNQPNQHWYLESFEGYQVIRNVHSSLVLDAHLPGTDKDGCRLQLWTCLKGRNQLWSVIDCDST